jgi:hypothetical protein
METMHPATKTRSSSSLRTLFGPDYERYEGVYKIHIYLLRLLFLLMIVFVGSDSWSAMFTHVGPWNHVKAVAFCVWAAYSTLSILGLINPLRMLPIVSFEIFYKSIWLVIVAYPLWSTNQLAGSPAEAMTYAFLWLPLPLLAVPWAYTFRTYFRFPRKTAVSADRDTLIDGSGVDHTQSISAA